MQSLTYLFYIDDDVIPLEGSLTLGNHLENDIVIPGEDVADFHLRVATDERGPEVIPLGQATVNVNGYEHDSPVRIIVGDVVGIGAETLKVGVEEEFSEFDIHGWHLVSEAGSVVPVDAEMTFGRIEEADITIDDPHVSRIHARLLVKNHRIWLQDLRSANGTRVNGQRIVGGVELFHGDQISVDRHVFQVTGESDELTPVNRFVEPLRGTSRKIPAARPVQPQKMQGHTGAYLLGRSGVLAGERSYLQAGSTRLGTATDCDIHWTEGAHAAVAEIELTVEGFVLTRITGKDSVRVNGEPQDRVILADGDEIEFGEALFEFVANQTQAQASELSIDRRLWVLGMIVVITGLVVVLLLL